MDKTKGIILALISSGTFGLIAFFSIPLLKVGMHAPSILFYRSLLSATTLAVICLIRKKQLRVSSKQALQLLFLGMLYTMTSMALIYSYSYISSGVSTTIHFLYPIVVASMMTLFYKEKLSKDLFVTAFLSLVGVALLCWSDKGFINTKGLLAALLTVFTYSTFIVSLNRGALKKLQPEVLNFYVMMFGALIFSVFSYSTTGIQIVPDTASWANLVGLGLFATILPGLALVVAVKYAGSTITSILGSLEPVVATLVGITYFSEPFGWNSLFGLCLIIGAVLMVIVRNKNKKRELEIKD